MPPATTWNGMQDLLYKSGIPADYEVPYGKLETNVLLNNGKVLLGHSLLSYNEYGASFHENPESTTDMIPKEKIRIVADANEIIYQFLPCNTLRRFCDYLSELPETSGLEPRPSGKNIKIPNISVIGDGGNTFNGTLIGFNKKEKIIRVLLDPELLTKPFLNFPFEEHGIREIRREGEIVYLSSPLKKEDVFGPAHFR